MDGGYRLTREISEGYGTSCTLAIGRLDHKHQGEVYTCTVMIVRYNLQMECLNYVVTITAMMEITTELWTDFYFLFFMRAVSSDVPNVLINL